MTITLRAAVLTIAILVSFALTSEASRLDEISAGLDVSEDTGEYLKYETELAKMSDAASGLDKAAVLCQLARVRFLLGESESFGDKERLKFLDDAIQAADKAMSINPTDNRPLYWKSMSLLMKADVDNGFSSLGMVKDALEGFKVVQETDPSYDDAGAYRSHAKVLIDIPSWTFMADTAAAIKMLKKAVKLAPGSLLNRLYLAQAYNKDGRRGEAYAEVKYILAAPENKQRPKEDKVIREGAWSLSAELGMR
jgi:tetratricopeptide (TPR) repeat protein